MSLQEEIKKINEKIEALNKDRQSLMSELDAGVENNFPQFGDDYWYVDSDTEVMDTASYDGEYDQGRLSIGNVFRTREQAEFAVEKLKVEAELWKFGRPFEYGKFNYSLIFDIDGDNFRTDFTSYCPSQGAIYFESEEKAQQAINTVGADRIKKYIFGVED